MFLFCFSQSPSLKPFKPLNLRTFEPFTFKLSNFSLFTFNFFFPTIRKKDKYLIPLAANFAHFMLNFIGRTTRIREIGKEHYQKLEAENKRYILCLWHGRMFIPIFIQRKKGIVAMVSQHNDGEFIARAVEKMGYVTVRGSSTRGGMQALKEMVRIIRKGANGAMMPDGPRGPYHEFKEGTLVLAQLSGAYLVPMTHAAANAKVFSSWDKFVLAKPFSKVVVAYGEPVPVPKDADFTALKTEMETRMNKLVDDAERYLKEEWK